MPHDQNGNLIKVGDKVLIEAIVESVQTGVNYCNCMVKTVIVMPPYDTGSTFSINTAQCLIVDGDVADAEPTPAPSLPADHGGGMAGHDED